MSVEITVATEGRRCGSVDRRFVQKGVGRRDGIGCGAGRWSCVGLHVMGERRVQTVS